MATATLTVHTDVDTLAVRRRLRIARALIRCRLRKTAVRVIAGSVIPVRVNGSTIGRVALSAHLEDDDTLHVSSTWMRR